MREFVEVEELLDKNLLAEVPVYYFNGTPVKGQTVKIKDQKLEAAIEKCTKYNIEQNALVAKSDKKYIADDYKDCKHALSLL